MRKKIYQVVEVAENNDKLSSIYDVFMMITILISLVPLMTKSQNTFLSVIDIVTVVIFIVDYLMRLLTADYKLNTEHGVSGTNRLGIRRFQNIYKFYITCLFIPVYST